jgi:hypothetical protein
MDLISSFLYRLHDSVSQFAGPSAALRDIHSLEAQIELRRQALRDIEAIRCRLRPFAVRQTTKGRRPLQGRRVRRSNPKSRPPVGNLTRHRYEVV